jgi:hypothetical protein
MHRSSALSAVFLISLTVCAARGDSPVPQMPGAGRFAAEMARAARAARTTIEQLDTSPTLRKLAGLAERIDRGATQLAGEFGRSDAAGDIRLRKRVDALHADVEALDSLVRSLRLSAMRRGDKGAESDFDRLRRHVSEIEAALRGLRKELVKIPQRKKR